MKRGVSYARINFGQDPTSDSFTRIAMKNKYLACNILCADRQSEAERGVSVVISAVIPNTSPWIHVRGPWIHVRGVVGYEIVSTLCGRVLTRSALMNVSAATIFGPTIKS